ncbi:hypothetical protein L917_20040 [Phytophthora nicotianae]|uniref:Uncharacterized protein n=3 Tax=Phytophthora nicotianae TaxID=4792 RepID=V9DZB9_PHYNI|nr:hypothetical protein F443_20889 [Phytophthora nicotianae P1569]ETK72594.1 hypothetical protein L915_20302 [Phytophthora nicotianae]ETO60952.1 hypothetical protein F444_20908 [Phytophthora nicotianae P1976]ETL26045.1 hypothetical protein L916_20169 [Phytophthora nicotianae]ETL79264.1 hypothetical protein L917_20040 [Phytophthora nicotianae]
MLTDLAFVSKPHRMSDSVSARITSKLWCFCMFGVSSPLSTKYVTRSPRALLRFSFSVRMLDLILCRRCRCRCSLLLRSSLRQSPHRSRRLLLFGGGGCALGPFAVTDDDGAAAAGDCVDVPAAAAPSGSSQSHTRAVLRAAGRELRNGAIGSKASAAARSCAHGCTYSGWPIRYSSVHTSRCSHGG